MEEYIHSTERKFCLSPVYIDRYMMYRFEFPISFSTRTNIRWQRNRSVNCVDVVDRFVCLYVHCQTRSKFYDIVSGPRPHIHRRRRRSPSSSPCTRASGSSICRPFSSILLIRDLVDSTNQTELKLAG